VAAVLERPDAPRVAVARPPLVSGMAVGKGADGPAFGVTGLHMHGFFFGGRRAQDRQEVDLGFLEELFLVVNDGVGHGVGFVASAVLVVDGAFGDRDCEAAFL